MANCILEGQEYRRSEVDEKLAGKANSSHTHNYAGSTTAGGVANSATKLATGRTIRTNLASTATATFDGTASITPGVTGVLPIANGGTGGSAVATARTNLDVYSKSEVDTAISNASMGDYCPSWWKPGIAADATWFTNLHNYLAYTSSRALAIPLGLKKKVKLTSSVLGTTEHYIMVIGQNIDADKTLTF